MLDSIGLDLVYLTKQNNMSYLLSCIDRFILHEQLCFGTPSPAADW